MGPQFHETGYGRKFFEVQMPGLIKAIKENTEALNRATEAKEGNRMLYIVQEASRHFPGDLNIRVILATSDEEKANSLVEQLYSVDKYGYFKANGTLNREAGWIRSDEIDGKYCEYFVSAAMQEEVME